jgi:hypothetical protein
MNPSQFPFNSPQDQSMANIASIPEGYDANPEMPDEPVKILAHFKPEELAELDEAQGGITIDPETDLREYLALDQILKDPKIRDEIALELSKNHPKFAMGGIVDEPGRPQDPELEKLRLEGRNGDTELAIITPDLLEIFTEWAGMEPEINPESGLPEFFSFGNIFKSVVRVVGTMLGPVTGFAASKLTGQSTGAAFKNAFIGAALPAAAMGIPYLMGGAGGAGGLGGILGKFTGMGGGVSQAPGGGLVSTLASVGKMLPGMGEGAQQAAGQQEMPQAAGQQQGGGFLSGLMGGVGKALPALGTAYMFNRGAKEEQKNLRNYEKERKEEYESDKKRMGYYEPFNHRKPEDLESTNTPISRDEYKEGRIPRFFKAAGGGAIRGEGKGQEDNIPQNIKDGSYIIDASTVSDLGDGSTQAGFKELERYFSKVPAEGAQEESKGGYLKAMVSDGEYEIPPEQVTALGKGSNERGAKILEKFVKEIRAKKRTSGQKLPPKSKPVGGYLSMHAT